MTEKANKRLSISVRGVETDDWEDLADIFACPSVIHNTLQLPYLSRDDVRERIENPPSQFRGVVAVENERVVGYLGLHVRNGRQAHVAYLGMMVHEEFQGRGVGTALMNAAVNLAESWLNISRIELTVYPDNAAGVALYERFGFKVEGTLRDYAFRDGHYVDAILMARIREDE